MDFLISRNLSIFEVGDLETVAKEQAVSSGGKLDSLIKYSFNDAIYEVEISLGLTVQTNIMQIKRSYRQYRAKTMENMIEWLSGRS